MVEWKNRADAVLRQIQGFISRNNTILPGFQTIQFVELKDDRYK